MKHVCGEKELKIVTMEVTALGFHLAMRFKKAGVLKFPVEFEREIEGIEG